MKEILLAPEIQKAIKERNDIIQKAQEQISLMCQTILFTKKSKGRYELSPDASRLVLMPTPEIKKD